MSLLLDAHFGTYKRPSAASPFETTMKYQRCVKCEKTKDFCEFPLKAGASGARKNTCRKCSNPQVAKRVGVKGAAEWECNYCHGPYNHAKTLNCNNCGMPKEED